MRLLIFDIQNPIDSQVNGFGLYRSVVDGTEHLRIARVQIPRYDTYAHCHPWEVCDTTDEGLGLVIMRASHYHFNADANPTACTSTQIWEIEEEEFRNSEDDDGYRGSHLWEIEWLTEQDEEYTQTGYTWAYCSTLDDDELGVLVENDNNVPPFASLVAEFQEHIFVAGDEANPHYLYWSKRFRPESYPLVNFIEVGNADDPITQIVAIAGLLAVFKRSSKFRVTGNAASGFVHWEALSHRGTRSPKSVKATDKGIIFVADDGVYITHMIAPDEKISQKIEGLFMGEDADANMEEEPINKDYIDQIAATYFKNKYYFSYPAGMSTTNNRTAVYDCDTHEWTIFDHALSSMVTEDDSNILVAGGSDGNLYVLETGQADDAADIEFEAKTKEFYEGAGYGVRCLFLYFKVDAKVPAGETITANFIVDGVTAGSASITGDRTKVLNPLPEGCWGYHWQIQLQGETDKEELEVAGVAALYLPLGVS